MADMREFITYMEKQLCPSDLTEIKYLLWGSLSGKLQDPIVSEWYGKEKFWLPLEVLD